MIIFDTFMNTPLGQKKGLLQASIENGKVTGNLSMLGHKEPIMGTIDAHGNCTLSGRFITLLHSVDFSADGTLHHDALQMRVRGNGCVYELF